MGASLMRQGLRVAWACGLALLCGIGKSWAGDDSDLAAKASKILSERCLRCHGGTSTKGGLNLSTHEGLLKGGKNGAVIVAGKAVESPLVEMVSGDVPEMPKNAKPLSEQDVETLRNWIDTGARWQAGLVLTEPKGNPKSWWAIQPLVQPSPPQVQLQPDRVRNPIDAFVLQRLERVGLKLSPEADKRTLIRRLSFDLLGLPPEPPVIDAFLEDNSPDAYEKLVEMMLASPRYGERWASHWLDVVHYGDTHGYDKDKRRDNAWPYRDYVIDSLNGDMPYDRFVREQIAGDVLYPDDPGAMKAIGFIAAGPWDFVGQVELREGTVDKEKTRLIDRDDMLANAMSTFNSLTVHCARCHDHKFDPIPQKDYYRLQAVFAGVDRGDRPYPSKIYQAKVAKIDLSVSDVKQDISKLDEEIHSSSKPEVAEIEKKVHELEAKLAGLVSARPAPPSGSNGYHSGIEQTPNVAKWVQVDLGRAYNIDEIRLIPARPVDFADTPGFGFPLQFKVQVANDASFGVCETVCDRTAADEDNPGNLPFVVRPGGKSARYIRVTAQKLWKRLNDFAFALAELEVISQGKNVAAGVQVEALDSIDFGLWGKPKLVDGADSRVRRDDQESAKKIADAAFELARLRENETSLIDPALVNGRKVLAQKLENLQKERSEAAPPQVYAAVPHAPRPIYLLKRGDVEQPGEMVSPGALSCIPGLESDFSNAKDEGQRRRALADWFSSTENMLTWRSIANRVWHYHFGKGIVDTPNDFGRNGSLPTHPELLDWLAFEIRNGKSIKQLHRLIVTSSVYRQSSNTNPEGSRLDSDNRLFWRQNRQRLDAECIRDGRWRSRACSI